MGWLRDKQLDAFAGDARQAHKDGLPVFITVLSSGTLSGAGGIEVRLQWAQDVAAIEAEGWRLEHWTVDLDGKGQPQGFPVFRRA
jgi:hypothetical protein